MKSRDYLPGVPAAGHITGTGFWHPGRADNCQKNPCRRENERRVPAPRRRDSER